MGIGGFVKLLSTSENKGGGGVRKTPHPTVACDNFLWIFHLENKTLTLQIHASLETPC